MAESVPAIEVMENLRVPRDISPIGVSTLAILDCIVQVRGIELFLIGLAAIAAGAVNALAGGGTLITFPVLTAATQLDQGLPPTSLARYVR